MANAMAGDLAADIGGGMKKGRKAVAKKAGAKIMPMKKSKGAPKKMAAKKGKPPFGY